MSFSSSILIKMIKILEMMETEAEENKQSRQGKLTDISKLVFTIYFRILKECPKSRLLSSTLEGLAKYIIIKNLILLTYSMVYFTGSLT